MKKGHLLLIEHFNGRTLPATEQNLKPNILALILDSFCRPQLAEEINHFLFGNFECKEIHPIYNNLNVDVCV